LITNVAVDFETNKIFRKLCTREKVGWSLSFDNVGDRFEYVRYGASWQQLLANITQVRRLMRTKNHWGGIHAVYNIYNATHLVDITQFARDNDLSIQWQSLYQPEYLDPARLGSHVAGGARNELEKLLATDLCTSSERQFFENVLANMQSHDDLRLQFAQHIHDIENKYHVNSRLKFTTLWPELHYIYSDKQHTFKKLWPELAAKIKESK
jgi:hypothetical protein